MSKKFSYEKSMAELEDIIQSIQSEQVGLDELSDLIIKAKSIFQKCQEKLRIVEEEITSIENNGPEHTIQE